MGRGAGRCLQLQGSESIGGRSARRVHARRATGHVTTVTRARACSKHSIAVACADSGADSEPRPEAPGEDRRAPVNFVAHLVFGKIPTFLSPHFCMV